MDTSKMKPHLKGSSDLFVSALRFIFLPCLVLALTACPSGIFAQEPGDVIDQEAGFYYTVKKGDTLWDLSERFSDSPWLWPDLWKENDQIPNPHWIYPGNRIRLYHKEWTKVLEKPAEEAPPAPEPVYFLYRNIDLVDFIRKEAVSPSAVIFESKDEHALLSKDDLVYVRKEGSGAFIPGSRFVVYRTMDAAINEETGKPHGIQHVITGIIEIISEAPEFAVGKIAYSLRPVFIGDQLMPLTPRSDEIEVVDSVPGIQGNVISSENHSSLFGDHTIAFFDKGSSDGIRPGQIYQVFDQKEAKIRPDARETVMLPPFALGEVFVLRTEENTSTVVVTSSKEPIKNTAKIRSMVQ